MTLMSQGYDNCVMGYDKNVAVRKCFHTYTGIPCKNHANVWRVRNTGTKPAYSKDHARGRGLKGMARCVREGGADPFFLRASHQG